MHALKMAVFDFDGTLVDSVPAIARGIQLANEEIGIAPVSYETAKSIIGVRLQGHHSDRGAGSS